MLAHAKAFWQTDCTAFADSVVGVFEKKFSERGEPATADQLFDAFELTLLVLTRSVETSRAVTRASGIGRGRPILWIAAALILGALLWQWLM
jgi:hypothetical protein